MFDFKKINAFENGQRDSFEELVCVLAKRMRPDGGVSYQRIEGSGGDGGVESIWIKDNGSKIGYQAKYFTSSRKIDWSQIDKSVKRALDVHPELKEYVVALPCNLTHKRKFLSRGGSGWEKWGQHVEKWQKLSEHKGIEVEFIPWTESDLIELLTTNQNVGIAKHWFGANILTPQWCEENIDKAVDALDDRYNPDHHVDVSLLGMLDAVAGSPLFFEEVKSGFSSIQSLGPAQINLLKEVLPEGSALLSKYEQSHNAVVEIATEFTEESEDWPVETALSRVSKLGSCLQHLIKAAIDGGREDRKFEETLSEIASNCRSQYEYIASTKIKAYQRRYALISGGSGVGKSHMLAHLAEKRIQSDLPTILLLGQEFSNNNLWEQLGGILGFEEKTADTILGSISALADRMQQRALFLIDALNDGAGSYFWSNNLSHFLFELNKYDNIALIVSCRSEYLPFTVPEGVRKSLPEYELSGFGDEEEYEKAAEAYCDRRGIIRPDIEWMSSVLSNPLFLKSVTDALACFIHENV